MRTIIAVIKSVFLMSADRNFFGSRRSKKLEEAFQNDWKSTQNDIESLTTMNPFQSAAAKSAMAKASTNAKMMQNKVLNTMGMAGATPEAIIAAEGQAQQAVGDAAGQIAVGAEANKNAQLNALKGLKNQQMGMESQQIQNTAAAQAMGIEAIGKGLEGAGGVAGLFIKPV